jgi:hypothetical protein
VPKNNLQILALDQKLKITQNDINTTFNQVPKKNGRIFSLDRIINKTFDQVKIIKRSFDLLPKFVKY